MDGKEGVPQKEIDLNDRDLCALEGWILGSSHEIPLGDTTEHLTVSEDNIIDLFQSQRDLLLIPNAVLRGNRDVEQENAIRSGREYTSGILVIFGTRFMFGGPKRRFILDQLDEDGRVSKITIQFFDGDQVVNPNTLGLDLGEPYKAFFDEPLVSSLEVILPIKSQKKT